MRFRRAADTPVPFRAFVFIWLASELYSWALSQFVSGPLTLIAVMNATGFVVISSLAYRKWIQPARLSAWNERTQIVEELIRRDLQMRALFDTTPLGIIMLDSKGRFLKANDAYQKITGYTEDELRRLSIHDVTHPEHLDEAHSNSSQQKPKVRKDGSTVWVQITSTQIDSIDGIEAGTVISVVEDVTEKRRITLELERKTGEALQEKSNFETFVYGLDHSAGVLLTDSRGEITYVNEKYVQMSGYEPEELIGRNVEIVRSQFHSADFYATMAKDLAAGRVWHGELCNRAKDGEHFWVEASLVPVLTGEGSISHFVAVYFDITARKAAEKNLIYSSKMASLGEMASGLAHEINNPLAIIQGKVQKIQELAEAPTIEAHALRKDLDRIHITTERIARIVRGLRTFSRQGDADPLEPTSIRDVIHQTLDLCAERFKSKGVLVVMCEIPDLNLSCRATELSQVLLNLLNNAFDAVRELDEKWIRIEVRNLEHERIEFMVTDSGTGIPDTVAERIMQPFFTTKPVGQGTGLGLSISRGIIEAHQGSLYLDRTSPHTRFVIQLPLTPAVPARSAA
jgi:hypothetical protein